MNSAEKINSLKSVLDVTKKNLHRSYVNLHKFAHQIRQAEGVLSKYFQLRVPTKDSELEKITSNLSLIDDLLKGFNEFVVTSELQLHLDENSNLMHPYSRFAEYPGPEWCLYKTGYKFNGIISEIKNAAKGYFYVINRDSSVFYSLFDALHKGYAVSHQKYSVKEVANGSLMAVKVDDNFVRVLVEKDDDTTYLFLVDLGELIEAKHNMHFYELTEYYKILPSQAIPCKIKDLPKKETAANFLSSNLYSKFEFEVVNFDQDVVHVRVQNYTSADKSESNRHDCSNILSETNPFRLEMLPANDSLNITEEDRKMLFEETETTENAMVAVMGYDPKDEARYCKYYDPQTGGCFKGANCTLLHKPPLEDGWTRDKQLVVTAIPDKLPIPSVGSRICIIPTHAKDVHLFYGHILNPEYTRHDQPSLKSFHREINCEQNKKKFKPFSQNLLPAQGELVLAMYHGYYYRARVILANTEGAEVFYVDYGNVAEVPLSNMFQWEKKFGDLPFQAFLFRIGNIKPNPTKTQSKRSCTLMENIELKKLSAIVLDNVSEIVIRGYFDDMDLGEMMYITGFAVKLEEDVAAKTKFSLPG